MPPEKQEVLKETEQRRNSHAEIYLLPSVLQVQPRSSNNYAIPCKCKQITCISPFLFMALKALGAFPGIIMPTGSLHGVKHFIWFKSTPVLFLHCIKHMHMFKQHVRLEDVFSEKCPKMVSQTVNKIA